MNFVNLTKKVQQIIWILSLLLKIFPALGDFLMRCAKALATQLKLIRDFVTEDITNLSAVLITLIICAVALLTASCSELKTVYRQSGLTWRIDSDSLHLSLPLKMIPVNSSYTLPSYILPSPPTLNLSDSIK